MGTIDGTLVLHEDETGVEVSIDWSDRHEVVVGQTISSPAVSVMLDGSSSSQLTVNTPTVSGNTVQFEVSTTADAVVGVEYEIECFVTLSGGARIKECLTVIVEAC